MADRHEALVERLIMEPVEAFLGLSARLPSRAMLSEPMGELWPTVDRLVRELGTERVVERCTESLPFINRSWTSPYTRSAQPP